MPTLNPDLEMANRFLDVLTGSTSEAATFQFFTDNKELKASRPPKRNDPLALHMHKNRPIDFSFAKQKQRKGAGVWVMVNAGDGKGRKKENVVKVRALFVDLDGSPWEPAATALTPHMRVESSPGKWHLYWLVSDCPLDQFTTLQKAIAMKFDGDKSCCDLPRVLRVPGFYHLKDQPVMTKLVEINDELPQYTTQQVIDGLGLGLTKERKTTSKRKDESLPHDRTDYTYTNTTTGEVIDLAKWAAQHPDFDIVKAINPEYALGPMKDGKQHVVCPFIHEHTDSSEDLATFVVNATPPEHQSFTIYCMHNHCVNRDRLEFLRAMLEQGWIPESVLNPAPLEPRKPHWIKYTANEVESAPELAMLTPDEKRIALHLQQFAWLQDDGTIEDDDWQIARYLGLTADSWIKYREVLTKAGWLISINSRLTNRIAKKYFDDAQLAMIDAIERGRNGGIRAQEKRRMSLQ